MSDTNRARDLVLAPNEYAYISDETKGNINVYVGPYKTSLANTDKPVVFDAYEKRFVQSNLEESISVFTIAPEGWYIVLKNPETNNKQPNMGTPSNLPQLNVGRKVNLPGPVFFALWPGQTARVLQGHHLQYNQYLLVRVYDELEAKTNWAKAVVKSKTTEDGAESPGIEPETPVLTIGSEFIIKGSEVSFYIPPTGIEVVRDEYGQYVREAVTLERMEYCILRNDDGNKRFVKGPGVVFPEPTEAFIEDDGKRKYRAFELNELSGIYVKVIAPFTEDGKEYKEGEELFITGKQQMIYYPRPEHAVIKYGQKDRHFAVAIPAGEGRYYLNRKSGTITLIKGPAMFLPDPREAVIVRRIIEPNKVALWFPGNTEAVEYNRTLKQLARQEKGAEYVTDTLLMEQSQEGTDDLEMARTRSAMPAASARFKSDSIARGTQYTQPRTITLDTKYEGAVNINVWTGYAVMIVGRTGKRQVIVGPQSYILEYDEDLQVIELSTGTPKSDEKLIKSVYLRTLNNKISDVIHAQTSDFCDLTIRASYRLNFEGDPERWFNVENYVQFLCDHLRSLIRNLVKKHTIIDFYSNGISYIRDTVLGPSTKDAKRIGRLFEENGMRVYDLEVLDIALMNADMEQQLLSAQHNVIKQLLNLNEIQRKTDFELVNEEAKRKVNRVKSETTIEQYVLKQKEVQEQYAIEKLQHASQADIDLLRLNSVKSKSEIEVEVAQLDLSKSRIREEFDVEMRSRYLAQRLQAQAAEVDAVVRKAQAVSPDLIAALQAFSDRALAQKVAHSMAPLSILGGKSVAEVFAKLLQGTVLADVLNNSTPAADVEIDDDLISEN
jgi:major vault protein